MTETKEPSCMYGEEIRKKCTVRIELAKGSSPDISKWIKPSKNEIFDEAEKLLDKMVDVNNALVSFCELCPFLLAYIEKQHPHP